MCGACEDEIFLTTPDPSSVLAGAAAPAPYRLPIAAFSADAVRPPAAQLRRAPPRFQAREAFGIDAGRR